ncbi:MAG TPA: MFS transporter [Candidatus Limnocylindria bacterium]|nr:MFS transporter [Candidatus Limnocylindria bacterium]
MNVTDRSYRALLGVPTLPRVLVSMQVARVAQSMVGVALVLFTLDRFGSPAFAGLVTFASVFPGLLISPIAGALLDRHGRIRLVLLDYVVALVAMVAIGLLALVDALPEPVLLVIAIVGSLTSILSHVGLRSLFPILVPEPLWERVNAVDSNGYVAATIIGPPIAATLVALIGGPLALLIIGAAFGLAAAALVGVPDPDAPMASTGRVLADAWAGLRYTWRNRTLRGLGFMITLSNLTHGMMTIVLPIVIIQRYGLSEIVVGLVYAISGVAGMLSSLLFGRMDTRGREWSLLVWPQLALVPVAALLLVAVGLPPLPVGLGLVIVEMALVGILIGPMDIGLFTVRQRRTDPAWMGRAFAVSMAFNYLGMPVGAALAGLLADRSVEGAILVLGIGGAVAATLAAYFLVPRTDDGAAAAPAAALPEPVVETSRAP